MGLCLGFIYAFLANACVGLVAFCVIMWMCGGGSILVVDVVSVQCMLECFGV